MKVKMVVFDMAGTTVVDNNSVAIAFRNAFIKNGFEITLADTHPYMGVKKIVAVASMLQKLQVPFSEQDVQRIHDDFVEEMVMFYTNDNTVQPFADTEEVFTQLRQQGIAITLNTGFPKVIADAIVERFGWKKKQLITDYIASDEVEHGRPGNLMIQQLMKRAGISSGSEVAKVGDTFIDIEEGKNAGCGFVIAVTTGSGTKEELEKYHPTHIVDSLSEIVSILC